MKSIQAESPRGWLGLLFGDTNNRRLVVAFAFAIALHEIAAMGFPIMNAQAPPEKITAVRIALETKPTPKPTPMPTPRPIIAPKEPHPRIVNAGKPAQKEIVRHAGATAPKIKTVYHSKPVWDVPLGAHGNGAGKNGTYGSLGNGGNGTGQGATGNGPGSGPCGFVDFVNVGGPQYDKRTGGFFVTIRMVVDYADGHSDEVVLDYPFYYASDAADPWSDRNKDDPDFPTLFQFPPTGKRAGEPPIVQYVMNHTDGGGYTTLTDCPASPSPQ